MKNIETLKRGQVVELNTDARPLSGDKLKFLGWYGHFGNLVRLSRVGDCAKLTVLPADIGYAPAPQPEPTPEQKAQYAATLAEQQAAEAARSAHYGAPHADETGPSRFVVTHTVLAGKDSGTFGIHLTPGEEREYNRGCAQLAALG